MMFNAISKRPYLLGFRPAGAAGPPAGKKSRQAARGNKLALLESTFELRLERARYDGRGEILLAPVATVMNSSDDRREETTSRATGNFRLPMIHA